MSDTELRNGIRRWWQLGVAAMMLAACGSSQPAASAVSGIEGMVVTQSCPQAKQNQTCPTKPFTATVQLLDPDGLEVNQMTPDAGGHFRVEVAAGKYVLHPLPPNPAAKSPDQTIEVKAGQFVSVTVTFDTGVR